VAGQSLGHEISLGDDKFVSLRDIIMRDCRVYEKEIEIVYQYSVVAFKGRYSKDEEWKVGKLRMCVISDG